MSTQAPPLNPAALLDQAREQGRVLLTGVPWLAYVALADGLGEQPVRVTYDRGRLEVMTVGREHEIYRSLLAQFVVTLADELDLPLGLGGSMTFRRENLERGLEPDGCYWVGSESKVRGRLELDLSRDPPPDLAVEVEGSRSALDRIGTYAALGVPEVWRVGRDQLQVGVRQPDGSYLWGEHSPTFAGLPLAEAIDFLRQALRTDHLSVVRAFRGWVRQRR